MCGVEPALRPKVLIRADASRTTGFGHFVRSCALAGYLRSDFDCRIASYNAEGLYPSPFQTGLIAEAGAKAALPERTAPSRKAFDEVFLEMVGEDDIVVLDNYYYTTAYQSRVRERAAALVCIDDMHDRRMDADMVMTFCPLTRADFEIDPSVRFLGGIEWSLLRPPFLEAPADTARDPHRIVIAMGGADPYGLTDRLAAMIMEIRPEVSIDVLAGDTVRVTPHPGLRIWRGVDAAGICRIFDRASLGIFPASTVCVEALSRRLPIAAGHYVDNQREFYVHGVKQGWFAPLGYLLDNQIEIKERLTRVLLNPRKTEAPDIDFKARRLDIIKTFKTLC